nr:hypothetical protein GCM10020093_021350 [Planobispora longispora]
MRRDGAHAELGRQRVHAVLARSDELAAEIDDLAVGLDAGRAAADPVAGLEEKDCGPVMTEAVGAREAGHAGADHDDVDVGALVGHVVSWGCRSSSRHARTRQRTHLPPRR